MKVLALSNLYPPDFIGGYELACAQVVDALGDRGHEVRVLTGAPRLPIAPSPPHVLRRFKLVDEWAPGGIAARHPLAFRLAEAESRLVNAYNVHALLTVLEEFAPDVVYVCCVTGVGGFGLLGCLQYLGVPWVWQLGDRAPHHLCSTRQSVIPGLAEAFSRHIEGNYITVSNQLRLEIESAGIRLNGRVDSIPNWITGTPGPVRSAFYRGGRLRILSAGQVGRWKGSDVLIESAARLLEAGYDDFSVDIYGKLFEPDLAELIPSLGLGRHVVLKGVVPQAELLRRYADYDVFAFPTLEREPFGLVPLEALARDCVPILSRRCGVAEWLVHGVHCLKADRTPEAFAGAFASIIDGAVDLEPIARRGRAAAWRDFHLDAILPRIERLLALAAAGPRVGEGTAREAYRLALLAEQLAGAFLEESLCA